MIKFYAMLTRRADLTHERFSEHWRTVHRELAVKIRRTRRYAQSHGIEERLAGLRSAAWDGVAEVWLDDLAAASRSDPDLERYAKPDEPNFLAPDGIPQICAEHRVVVPPPEDGVKALVFGDRRDPSTDLERWWEAAASIGDLCDDPAGLAAAVSSSSGGATYRRCARTGSATAPPFSTVWAISSTWTARSAGLGRNSGSPGPAPCPEPRRRRPRPSDGRRSIYTLCRWRG